MTNTATTDSTTASLPQRIKSFYERMGRERDRVLPELPHLYTTDVRFQNPVGDYQGLDAFRRQWERAFSQYKEFEVVNIEYVGDDRTFTMTYSMNVSFAIGPTFRLDMSTDFEGRDGKVYITRDYFDVMGSLLSPFPIATWLYKKIFGLVVA